MHTTRLLVFLLILSVTLPLRAESPYAIDGSKLTWTQVEKGLSYATYVHEGEERHKPKEGEDPWLVPPTRVHFLRAQLGDSALTVRSLRPLGRSQRLEKIVEVFRTGGVDIRAALNGDYFAFHQNEKDPHGLHISGGQLLRFPAGSSALVIDERNRGRIARYTIAQTASANGTSFPVHGANREARKHENVLYSGYYMKKTLAQGSCTGILLERGKLKPMINNRIQVTVIQLFSSRKRQKLKPRELALVVCDDLRDKARTMPLGTVMTIDTRIPEISGYPIEAIAGGPRILRDGKVVNEMKEEGFALPLRLYIPQRHPRSAVGFSRDGKTVYLLAAEGRIPRSAGLTAEDSAVLLAGIGATDAMLFDGGGSVALLGPQGFYNVPHKRRNRTARSIANALAIVRRKKKK